MNHGLQVSLPNPPLLLLTRGELLDQEVAVVAEQTEAKGLVAGGRWGSPVRREGEQLVLSDNAGEFSVPVSAVEGVRLSGPRTGTWRRQRLGLVYGLRGAVVGLGAAALLVSEESGGITENLSFFAVVTPIWSGLGYGVGWLAGTLHGSLSPDVILRVEDGWRPVIPAEP